MLNRLEGIGDDFDRITLLRISLLIGYWVLIILLLLNWRGMRWEKLDGAAPGCGRRTTNGGYDGMGNILRYGSKLIIFCYNIIAGAVSERELKLINKCD